MLHLKVVALHTCDSLDLPALEVILMGWMTMNFRLIETNNTLLMRSTTPQCSERLDLPELTTFCLPPTTELIGNPLTDCNYVYLESLFRTPLLKCRYTKSNKCDYLHPRSSAGERSGHSQSSIWVSLMTRRGRLLSFLQLSAVWFLYSIVPVSHYHVCARNHPLPSTRHIRSITKPTRLL